MRIAYFTDTFLPQLNGIATSLAAQATKLGEEGHSVLIFTPKLDHIQRAKFKAKNVTVVYLPAVSSLVYTEFKLTLFGLPKIIKYLTKFKPDIIHLHSTFTIAMDAVMAAKIFKKPLVGTIHIYFTDTEYLRFVKYKLAVRILDKFAKRYLNFLFRQCDLLLTPSKNLVEDLKSDGFKKEIFYQPNGIVLNEPKILSNKDKEYLRKKYKLKEKVILHFGRLSYEKNIDVLIKAFSTLSKTHQNATLMIIGDGPAKKNLIKLTKKLGLEKQVRFTGFIDNKILIDSGLLTIGDIFATASAMENNPMSVLEAMASKLPIVGVNQAGLMELVSTNGFLVKVGNAKELAEKMAEILDDQKMADRMGEESARLVKEYSIDKTTQRLLGFYRKLLP